MISRGFFRCLDCKKTLESLNIFAHFSTPKGNSGQLLTHKILRIVGLSKTCFLTDSYYSNLSDFWLRISLLEAWGINVKILYLFAESHFYSHWHSCINTLKFSNGLLSFLVIFLSFSKKRAVILGKSWLSLVNVHWKRTWVATSSPWDLKNKWFWLDL